MISMMLAAALATQALKPPSEAQFQAARAALNEQLLDYPSARFRDVRGSESMICGYVNSKNRLGAYTGWSRFAAYAGGSLYISDQDGGDAIMVEVCDMVEFSPDPDLSDRLTAD